MQQRYYDPLSGRFLSVDPMPSDVNSGWNFNRFNYASNNPYRFTDPDGRGSCDNSVPNAFMCAHPEQAGGASPPVPGYPNNQGLLTKVLVFLGVLSAQPPVIESNGQIPPSDAGEAGQRIKELVGDVPTTEGVVGLQDKGWEWKGKAGEAVGGSKGAFVNPETGEQIHNDLDSHATGTDRGPHVTYTGSDGKRYDHFPETDTTVEQQ